MANSYTLTSSSTYDGRKMTLTCTQTKNITKNQSTINWTLTTSGGTVNDYATGPTTVTIAGTQVYYKGRTSHTANVFPARHGSTSGTLTVNHDSLGKKSVSVSLSTAIYNSTVKTDSGTWTLDNIPRAATVSAGTDFTDESNPTVTWSNPAGLYVRPYLSFYVNGSRVLLLYAGNPSKTAYTSPYTWSLTEDQREQIRAALVNVKSCSVNVGIDTHTTSSVDSYLGYSYKVKTCTIVNAEPTITVDLLEVDDKAQPYLMDSNSVIKGVSDIQYSISAMTFKGASIKSYRAINGTQTHTTESNTFTNVQSGDFTFEVTDTRGYKATTLISKELVDYINPTINMVADMPNAVGETTLHLYGFVFGGSIGSIPNRRVIQYKFKSENDETYGEWITVNNVEVYDNTYSIDVPISGLDYQLGYTFQARIFDLFEAKMTDEQTVKSIPVFSWSKEDFQFNVPVYYGDYPMPYIVEQELDNENGWTYRKWSDGTAECWTTKDVSATFGSTSGTANWGSLFTSGSIAETNIPYPANLFIETPSLQANLMTMGNSGDATSGAAYLMAAGAGYPSNKTQTGSVEFVRGSYIANRTFRISYNAKGRWK